VLDVQVIGVPDARCGEEVTPGSFGGDGLSPTTSPEHDLPILVNQPAVPVASSNPSGLGHRVLGKGP
jgi:hypothetical protein